MKVVVLCVPTLCVKCLILVGTPIYYAVDKLRKLPEQHSENVMSAVCRALDVMPFRTSEVSFSSLSNVIVMQPSFALMEQWNVLTFTVIEV